MFTNGIEEIKLEYELFPEKYVTIYVDISWNHQKEKMYTSNGDIGWDNTSAWEITHISWEQLPHIFRDEEKVKDLLKKKISHISSNGIVFKSLLNKY